MELLVVCAKEQNIDQARPRFSFRFDPPDRPHYYEVNRVASRDIVRIEGYWLTLISYHLPMCEASLAMSNKLP